MALGCFIAATISFHAVGGRNFEIGSGFTHWLFWGMLFLSLPAIPALMGILGIQWVPPASGSAGVFAKLLTSLNIFVYKYLLAKVVPLVAAALVLKSLLDGAEEKNPVPSLVSALLVLSSEPIYLMANGWGLGSDGFGIADGLHDFVNWVGSNVCPAVGALCVIGAVINFVTGKPWGKLVITSIAMMCFSTIWILVNKWG
jgi:hypothetical protein